MNDPHHDGNPGHEHVDERLCDWVDGCMSERERERFEAELRVNPGLRQQLAEYERTVAAIRAALQAPTRPVPMADRVVAALASQQNRAAQPLVAMPWRGRSWRHLGWCAASAAALLMLALCIDSWAGREPEKSALVAVADEPGAGRLDEPGPAAEKPGVEPAEAVDGAKPGTGLRLQELEKSEPVTSPATGLAGLDSAGADEDAKKQTAPKVGGGGGGGRGAANRENEPAAAPTPPGSPPVRQGNPEAVAPPPSPADKGREDGAKSDVQPPAAGRESMPGGGLWSRGEGGVDKAPSSEGPSPGAPRGAVAPPAADGRRGFGGAAPQDEALVADRGEPQRRALPAAEGPWPEITVVGVSPDGKDESERVRLLLGFEAEDQRVRDLTKAYGGAGATSESTDESKAKRAATAPPARGLPEAELVPLMASFLRAARTTPAKRLQWPTRNGGLELLRFTAADLQVAESKVAESNEQAKDTSPGAVRSVPPATGADSSRLRADDVLWVVEGPDDELRLLLAQLGRAAASARWQLTSGEFPVELQQRVLADATRFQSTAGGKPAVSVPAPGGGGTTGSIEPTPPAGAPASPTRGGAEAAPGSDAPARRRLVLRFRPTP